jgi:hypothetical protein
LLGRRPFAWQTGVHRPVLDSGFSGRASPVLRLASLQIFAQRLCQAALSVLFGLGHDPISRSQYGASCGTRATV